MKLNLKKLCNFQNLLKINYKFLYLLSATLLVVTHSLHRSAVFSFKQPSDADRANFDGI